MKLISNLPPVNSLPHTPYELSDILLKVSAATGVKANDIIGDSRKYNIKIARFIYSYLAYKYTSNSLFNIGAIIGDRHYTTQINAIGQIKTAIKYMYQDVTSVLEIAEQDIKKTYKINRYDL